MKARQVSTWTLDPAQRARVRNNLGLVASYLRRSTTIPPQPMSRCEYDDLFQEGTLGLMRAAVRYDPARDKTFAAFALKHIHAGTAGQGGGASAPRAGHRAGQGRLVP